jgi:hypothetical protein
MMPFHAAGEASPLGQANGVDSVSRLEQAYIQLLPDFVFGGVVDFDLSQMAKQATRALQVPPARVVEAFDLLKTELDAIVAVHLGGLDLRHCARSNLNDRDADGIARLSKELGRAYFSS